MTLRLVVPAGSLGFPAAKPPVAAAGSVSKVAPAALTDFVADTDSEDGALAEIEVEDDNEDDTDTELVALLIVLVELVVSVEDAGVEVGVGVVLGAAGTAVSAPTRA